MTVEIIIFNGYDILSAVTYKINLIIYNYPWNTIIDQNIWNDINIIDYKFNNE